MQLYKVAIFWTRARPKAPFFYLVHSPLHSTMVQTKSSTQLFTILTVSIHIHLLWCSLCACLSTVYSICAYVVLYSVKVAYACSVCVIWVCCVGMLLITAFTINLTQYILLLCVRYSVNICMSNKRSHAISISKTITWRILASLDTFILSWFITGSVTAGASIASLEVITKMFLYYAHERQWEKPRWQAFVLRVWKRWRLWK